MKRLLGAVLASAADLGHVYTIADQTGDNLDWDGGPADCEASLRHWVVQGRRHTITVLDSVIFEVE